MGEASAIFGSPLLGGGSSRRRMFGGELLSSSREHSNRRQADNHNLYLAVVAIAMKVTVTFLSSRSWLIKLHRLLLRLLKTHQVDVKAQVANVRVTTTHSCKQSRICLAETVSNLSNNFSIVRLVVLPVFHLAHAFISNCTLQMDQVDLSQLNN